MSEDNPTFQRCPHDKENPYTMISRELIRDNSLSPDCRWLIIYLLANKDNWKIHMRQIVNHCKGQIGRDRVYQIVNEAIEAGYMAREKYLVKGLERIRYLVSESPKFKKSLPLPENQDADIQDTENQDSKGIASSTDKQVKVPPSAIAEAMCNFLHGEIKKKKPNLRPISKSWYVHAEKLLKQRSPDELRKIIDWVVNEPFWSGVILSPDSLNKSLDKIEMQMLKRPDPKTSKVSDYAENKKWAEFLGSRYQGSDVEFQNEYVGFKFGPMSYVTIGYKENGFRDQVENCFRKLGVHKLPEMDSSHDCERATG